MHTTAAADRQHALAVQRPGQVAAVALCTAGTAGHDAGGRDDLGLCLTAAGAGEGLHTGLGFRRLLRHFAVVPCVAECVGISIHVAVAAGASVGRVALFRAGRRCDNSLVAVGMGNIIVMDVGGQKAIISSGRNRDRFPLRLAPGIVHIGQRCTRSESAIANARHAIRDRHAGQRSAAIESMLANARHAVRDRHAGQRCATSESTSANARHAVRDRICRKSARVLHQSCLIFAEQNTGCIAGVMTVALSDPYTGQRCAPSESTPANARHAVRDRHAGQRCTRSESAIANARHAVRDRHTGQRPALIESTPANARHAVWDRHAGQRCAA